MRTDSSNFVSRSKASGFGNPTSSTIQAMPAKVVAAARRRDPHARGQPCTIHSGKVEMSLVLIYRYVASTIHLPRSLAATFGPAPKQFSLHC